MSSQMVAKTPERTMTKSTTPGRESHPEAILRPRDVTTITLGAKGRKGSRKVSLISSPIPTPVLGINVRRKVGNRDSVAKDHVTITRCSRPPVHSIAQRKA